jgi:hypothetical protein
MKCLTYCDKAQEMEICLECAEHYALKAQYDSWKEGNKC